MLVAAPPVSTTIVSTTSEPEQHTAVRDSGGAVTTTGFRQIVVGKALFDALAGSSRRTLTDGPLVTASGVQGKTRNGTT
jgi:hypothetical protein